MQILFVSTEVAPYGATGTRGEVCHALAKALKGLGHRITICSPLYGAVDYSGRSLARRLNPVHVTLGETSYDCELYDGRTTAGVDLLFIGQKELFGGIDSRAFREPDTDTRRLAHRLGCLSAAALHIVRSEEDACDVIHAVDWTAALSLVWAKRDPKLAEKCSVFTFFDLAEAGSLPPESMAWLGLPPDLFTVKTLEFWGNVSLLKGGVVFADRVTTGSPAYAKEVSQPDMGSGIGGVLGERERNLVGILNGIDVATWNPATDPHLVSRFDPMNLRGKAACKTSLQQELGLPFDPEVPLVGLMADPNPDSGLDRFVAVAPDILRNEVQMAVVHTPSPAPIVRQLRELADRYADRLSVVESEDERLRHRLLSGSDLLLMPGVPEPGGLLQMQAQRYGTLPIGRRGRAFADSVVDCDSHLETGTGFTFDDDTSEDLLAATRRAIAAYFQRAAFEAVQTRSMRIDHSWERSARLYERIYKSVAPERG